jgi:hypothetical protein
MADIDVEAVLPQLSLQDKVLLLSGTAIIPAHTPILTPHSYLINHLLLQN